jgi:hypothetical protein
MTLLSMVVPKLELVGDDEVFPVASKCQVIDWPRLQFFLPRFGPRWGLVRGTARAEEEERHP